MIVSAESRAISLGAGTPHLCITTAHLPEGIGGAGFLSQYVSSTGFLISVELLGAALVMLPKQNESFCRPGYDFSALDLYAAKFLLTPLLSTPARTVTQQDDEKYAPEIIDRLHEEFAGAVPKERLELAARQSLAIGAALTRDDLAFLDGAWKELAKYDVSFSHSPELGAITLSKLIEGGIRNAWVVPLLAGVRGAVQAQMAGSYAVAFECALAGGGITLVTLSALWLSDKILWGLRSSALSGPMDNREAFVQEEFARARLERHHEERRLAREENNRVRLARAEPETASRRRFSDPEKNMYTDDPSDRGSSASTNPKKP